jgi:hypothetical protein
MKHAWRMMDSSACGHAAPSAARHQRQLALKKVNE